MNESKRNPALVTIGIILMVLGVIIFIVASINLYEVQHTESRWIEGFMQDYQARTNAENSIPCYMFMFLSAIMEITGIIMVAIKPRSTINVQNSYVVPTQTSTEVHPMNTQINFCPRCGNKANSDSKFCIKCGQRLI